MAKLIDNVFTSYELTDDEALHGSIYTTTQLNVLQSKLSEVATDKLNLEFDTSSPQIFIQQEAYLKGQLELIQYLIDSSNVSAEELQSPTQED
jgi:hypothetical protein